MNVKQSVIIALAATALIACSPRNWQIVSESSTRIAIDKSTDAIADSNYIAALQPFKQQVDRQMNVVIGEVAQSMRGHAPESLLSNFSSEVYRSAATDFLKEKVDISIVNLGGLRTEIPAGKITLRKVFELMPFENELVILWLKGDKLKDLIDFFAKAGGEGELGIRMKIHDGKAEEVTINGEPLDINRVYSIATNDYLAGGNDKMVQLAMYEKRLNTGIKIRNMLLGYIQNETRNSRKLDAVLDGRIRVY